MSASSQELEQLLLEAVHCAGGGLPSVRIGALEMIDTTACDVDLANVVARGAGFERVRFERSRLTGADLAESVLEDAVLEGCRLTLIGLRFARLSRVRFVGCDLSGADFGDADLSAVTFERCDVANASFFRATHRGTRFFACGLDGVDLASLRGASLDWPSLVERTAQLAALAGIGVCEPTADVGR